MERVPKNLMIEVGKSQVVKSSGGNYRRLNERLRKEYTALLLVSSHFPFRVPDIYCVDTDKSNFSIAMERLGVVKGVAFSSIATLVEDLQSLPVDSSLPILDVTDYQKIADTRLRYLKRLGPVSGLTKGEANRIERTYDSLMPYLTPFKTALVHGDVQSRHFASKNGQLAIFDFDQSHFGNELEDWAFLSIRHPRYAKEVRVYLRNKFKDDNERSARLDGALLLMQIDKLLHGYFSRTYQWRGRAFDIAAKIYGREKLFDFVRRTSRFASANPNN